MCNWLGNAQQSVAAFADIAAFKATIDAAFREIRQSEALPGHDPIRIPGDGRIATFEDRSENGIPLHPNLVKALAGIAHELRIKELS